MKELLKNSIDLGKIDDALIIGRNIVNRTPDDMEGVSLFMSFLMDLAENLPALDERRSYCDQAEVILSYISENAQLSNEYLNKISEMSNKIKSISDEITKAENIRIDEIVSGIELTNSQAMKNIYSICDELEGVKTQEEFDLCMVKLTKEDNKIDKEYLNGELKEQYDLLTKKCTELISKKMQELEHTENINYNRNAVDSFSIAFDKFKGNENLYKKEMPALCDLANVLLFEFDASRLLPETIIYYNYIYQYIFERVDENGKLALTKSAIEASKKRI